MNNIKIIGLGPGGKNYLTIEAYKEIIKSDICYLRTEKHPVIGYLEEEGANFISYDEVYEEMENFDKVYESIALDLIEKSKEKDVVYCVPGNPFVAERTVEILREKEESEELNLTYVYGASFIDAIITTIKRDPVHGFKIHDSLLLKEFTPETKIDNLFIQVYDKRIASDLKLALSKYYDDEYKVIVVRGAGIEGEEKVEEINLFQLDRLDYLDYLTSVYVPGTLKNAKHDFFDLVDTMEKLRGENGCPWDKVQTHETMIPCFLEETYEAIDAIKKYDIDEMVEELGDVLLQIVFHSQIGAEDGYFDIFDVIDGIVKKLINRHPHVFSDMTVESANEVTVNWEKIKNKEKSFVSYYEKMSKVPVSFPGLLKANKIQKIAADVGFDWGDVSGAVDKLKEELSEVEEVMDDNSKLQEELGDLLFSVVNVCRIKKINPELALEVTNNKFKDRFKYIEDEVNKRGEKITEKTLSELDFLWEEAKKAKKCKKN